MTLYSSDPDQTRAIGRLLGSALRSGDLVALLGPLGAGKTTLVKGIAVGAGLPDDRRVTSPTFVLVNEYDAEPYLFHVDAYRLGGPRELEALGLDEFLTQGAVLVEWADRVEAALPCERLEIALEATGDRSRALHLNGFGRRAEDLIRTLARAYER